METKTIYTLSQDEIKAIIAKHMKDVHNVDIPADKIVMKTSSWRVVNTDNILVADIPEATMTMIHS